MKRSGSLRPSDIEEYPKKVDEFRRLFKYIQAQNCPIYFADSHTPLYFKLIDSFAWRPSELYLFKAASARAKIPQHDIFHAAVHHLLVQRYGKKLRGRPRFTLLCECIATASELYFVLRNFSQKTSKRTEADCMDAYFAGERALRGDRIQTRESTFRKVFQSTNDPYGAFRKCVRDGMNFYEKLLNLAERRLEGEPFDISEVKSLWPTGRFGFVFTKYRFDANICFVIANCGRSTAEDGKLVKRCFDLLEGSRDYSEFLSSLGLS